VYRRVLDAGQQQALAIEATVHGVVLEQALGDLLVVRIVAETAGGEASCSTKARRSPSLAR
jgi:hypothetical protein